MSMDKFGVEDRRALIEKELAEVTARLDRLDKTAAADEIRRLNERKHQLEDALASSDA